MPSFSISKSNSALSTRKPHGFVTLGARDTSLPKARISAAGDFWIGETSVSVTPEQRSLLQQYYRQSMKIAGHGVLIAFKAVGLVFKVLFNVFQAFRQKKGYQATDDDIESHIEAQIAPNVDQLVGTHLRKLKDLQDNLAMMMPEFRPYACITEEDLKSYYQKGRQSRLPVTIEQ